MISVQVQESFHCNALFFVYCTFVYLQGKLVFAITGFAVIDYFCRTLAVMKSTEDDHLFTDFVIHAIIVVP